jgi:hypothetical protein
MLVHLPYFVTTAFRRAASQLVPGVGYKRASKVPPELMSVQKCYLFLQDVVQEVRANEQAAVAAIDPTMSVPHGGVQTADGHEMAYDDVPPPPPAIRTSAPSPGSVAASTYAPTNAPPPGEPHVPSPPLPGPPAPPPPPHAAIE